MINFFISYFYQIRNMSSNMLPVSTAMYDPAWFHDGKGIGNRYLDKNCVVNGVRMNEVMMDAYRVADLIKAGSMCGPNCSHRAEEMCPYMQEYAKCIRAKNPDFKQFITFCEGYVQFLNQKFNFGIDTIIFIVHENPLISCGERPVLQQWFEENGYELKEWSKDL